MSCKHCEENPIETYVRVGNGNVTIVGCEKHLRELIDKLRLANEVRRNELGDKEEE